MIEPDIRTFYQQRWVMVASDGGIGMRHPRGAGTFPRVLGRYVREQKWLTLGLTLTTGLMQFTSLIAFAHLQVGYALALFFSSRLPIVVALVGAIDGDGSSAMWSAAARCRPTCVLDQLWPRFPWASRLTECAGTAFQATS